MPERSPFFPAPPEIAPQLSPGVDASIRRLSTPLSYWCLLAFIFLLYINVPLLFPAFEVLRPAKLAAGGAVVLLIVESMFGRGRTFQVGMPEGALLLSFLAAAALSCLTALWPGYAVAALIDLAKMGAVFFVLVNAVVSVRLLRGIVWTMLAGGLFPALGAIRNYQQGNLIEGRASWIGVFANPNDLAYSLVVLVPLAGFLAVRRGLITRGILFAIMAIYSVGIFVTFSRGGALGLIAVLGWYTWRQRSIAIKILATVTVLAGLALAAQNWNRSENFDSLSTDNTVQSRLATSVAGLQMFLDHPITGVGLACSVVAWPLYAPQDLYTRGALVTHNAFIQSLSETGLLGFTTFLSFIGFGIYHARKLALHSANPEVANVATGLEIALWGFVVCGLANGNVMSWPPYILVGMVACLRRTAENE